MKKKIEISDEQKLQMLIDAADAGAVCVDTINERCEPGTARDFACATGDAYRVAADWLVLTMGLEIERSYAPYSKKPDKNEFEMDGRWAYSIIERPDSNVKSWTSENFERAASLYSSAQRYYTIARFYTERKNQAAAKSRCIRRIGKPCSNPEKHLNRDKKSPCGCRVFPR